MASATLNIPTIRSTWTDTGITVQPGATVTIQYHTSDADCGSSNTPYVGAPFAMGGGGNSQVSHPPPAVCAPLALAACVLPLPALPAADGSPIPAPGIPIKLLPEWAGIVTTTVPAGGRVYLAYNDYINCYSDNSGSYTVTVSTPDPTLTLAVSQLCSGAPLLTWNAIFGATYTLTRDGAAIYTGTATTFTDTGATLGTAHTWQIAANVPYAVSPAGADTATGTPNLPPPKVTGLTATPNVSADGCTVTQAVRWNAAARATGYTVTRTAAGGFTDNQTVGGVTATFASAIGQTDTFTVSASNGCGNAPASDPLTATPTFALATPTVTLCQKCCQQDVKVSWTAVPSATYNLVRDGVTIGTNVTTPYIDRSVPLGAHTYGVIAVLRCFTSPPGTATLTVRGWTLETVPATSWSGDNCGCK